MRSLCVLFSSVVRRRRNRDSTEEQPKLAFVYRLILICPPHTCDDGTRTSSAAFEPLQYVCSVPSCLTRIESLRSVGDVLQLLHDFEHSGF
jgi:hypothetical protein